MENNLTKIYLIEARRFFNKTIKMHEKFVVLIKSFKSNHIYVHERYREQCTIKI